MEREKQIEEMAEKMIDFLDRETVDKFIEDEEGNLARIETYSLYDLAKALYNAGYRKEKYCPNCGAKHERADMDY